MNQRSALRRAYFEKSSILDEELPGPMKSALLRASSSVVGVVVEVPPDMTRFSNSGLRMKELSHNAAFMGSGLIIDSQVDGDGTYRLVVLTVATPFKTRVEKPVRVQVLLADGDACAADVLGCDFHYNLAVLGFASPTRLQSVNLTELDDFIPLVSHSEEELTLRPHSGRYKIRPGYPLLSLGRELSGEIFYTLADFSVKYSELECNELYSLTCKRKGDGGGAVINSHGQVIGIMMVDEYFMPSNIISKWWNSYQQHKEFRRPWLGCVRVANLHASKVCFLEQLIQKFPDVSSGVIVTKVAEKSAAYQSGLRSEDVIVQCDGGLVRSTLEFFEKVWVKAGASADLTVLRLSNADPLKLTLTVGEAKPNNFYRWPTPLWFQVSPGALCPDSETEEGSGSETEEGSDSDMEEDSEST